MAETKDGLPVTPSVVQWARQRAGFSIEDAQDLYKNIAAWEAGEAMPSYPQLESMAEKFKCPVAVFFFPKPPALPAIEQSFRTISAEDLATIPRTVRLFLRRGQAMQLNLAELNDGTNPAKQLITRDLKVMPNSSLDQIAADVRDYLGVSIEEQVSWRTVEIAVEKWRKVFLERAGVYVFKDAFHAENYAGFCLYDDEFPIVYVNNSSAKSHQIFTLFHELGHLLFHTSGIDTLDDPFIDHLGDNERKIESICNGLAGRFLVPDKALDNMLAGKKADRELAALLADHFKVSREVIFRKFLDRNLIEVSEYDAARKAWNAQMQDRGKGGTYYNNHHAYLGQPYINLAFTRYYQRRFDEGQLADYLGIKPRSLATFEAKFGLGAGLL